MQRKLEPPATLCLLNADLHGGNDNDAESFIGGSPLTSPPSDHSAPYTQLSLSSITEGNTLSTTSLPLSLQSHVTLDEWHEFAMRMQPTIHYVDTFLSSTTPSNSAFMVILSCLIMFVLFFPWRDLRFLMAFWLILGSMAQLPSVWLRRAQALQLVTLRALCQKEDRFFRQRGLTVACDFVWSPGELVGFCLYFWPIPTNRDDHLTVDHCDHGMPNVYIRIRVDGLDSSSCNWWLLSATPPVSSHRYLALFQASPFSTFPAAMAVWNRFWPSMMQQSRELRFSYGWFVPFVLLRSSIHVRRMHLPRVLERKETGCCVYRISIFFPLLCLAIFAYGLYRISSIKENPHELVKAYANEFAAVGLWVEDRQVYEVNHSNGVAITAYHVYVHLLDHMFSRPDVV